MRTALPIFHLTLFPIPVPAASWRPTFIPFAPQNPEHLLLFAAGNLGLPEDPDRETCTINSPGGGKNVLTIGASSSGEARRSYTDENGLPRTLEVQDVDSVPGDIDTVAYFSSYGLMADGRIKPEVVAPGDQVRCVGNIED